MEALKERFILNFVTDDRWKYITDGLKVTLEVTFLGNTGRCTAFDYLFRGVCQHGRE